MDIKINKDIAKEYPDDSWKGFSLSQLLYIFAAVAAGAAVVCFLYFLLGFNIHIAVYGAFPVAAPIALVGFYRYAGMRFPEAAKNWLRLNRTCVLPYAAAEAPDHLEQIADATEDPKPEGKRTKRKRKKEKRKEGQPWDS